MAFSNTTSRFFGLIANTRLPKSLQTLINRAYVRHYDIDMSDFGDLGEYESLNALFKRHLKRPRTLESGFISPCDGKVFEWGTSFRGGAANFAFSIKGCTYNLNELLIGSGADFAGGADYANLYLSPSDYHHFHAPCDMQVLSATYTRGELHSVGTHSLQRIANLYVKNERVALKCRFLGDVGEFEKDFALLENGENVSLNSAKGDEKGVSSKSKDETKSGEKALKGLKKGDSSEFKGVSEKNASSKAKTRDFDFWLVFVGAQNVGKMHFVFDEKIHTNAFSSENFTREYDGIIIKKGSEFGHFELGSTIVVVCPKNTLKFTFKKNSQIKMGNKIAEFVK